jgi:UDP-glucose 4-epimerase
MHILVTGGAGFIGSHVVDAYLEAGHTVAVIDNLSTGRRENLNPKAVFYEADIREKKEVDAILSRERFDLINHHAAQADVRRSVEDPVYDLSVNVIGSLHLLEAAVRNGLKKFIHISSGGAVYGEPQSMPVDESHPVNPACPYGVTKHTVEHYLATYRENFGLAFTVLRYANVYGPRQNPKGEAGVVAIFSLLILQGLKPTIFGDGSKTRDYVFVGDIVRANLEALHRADGKILNLGTGIETRDIEVFEAIRHALGVDVEPVFGEKRKGEIERICLSADAALDALGWTPRVSFEEGIRTAVRYYRNTFRDGRWQ